jgi:hypothetical protein
MTNESPPKDFPAGIVERRRPFSVDLSAAFLGGLGASAVWDKGLAALNWLVEHASEMNYTVAYGSSFLIGP